LVSFPQPSPLPSRPAHRLDPSGQTRAWLVGTSSSTRLAADPLEAMCFGFCVFFFFWVWLFWLGGVVCFFVVLFGFWVGSFFFFFWWCGVWWFFCGWFFGVCPFIPTTTFRRKEVAYPSPKSPLPPKGPSNISLFPPSLLFPPWSVRIHKLSRFFARPPPPKGGPFSAFSSSPFPQNPTVFPHPDWDGSFPAKYSATAACQPISFPRMCSWLSYARPPPQSIFFRHNHQAPPSFF